MEYDRPKTIEELKAFCAEKGMPLEQMRFYIGEDFPEPRAFGIFQDENGEFVVYKNKADGTRSVRYHGTDEAYAVNELYEKLKSETPAEWTEADADTYFVSENYSYTLRVDNFAKSDYYREERDSFDWGSGSDYDDWDSDDTDWDSDW